MQGILPGREDGGAREAGEHQSSSELGWVGNLVEISCIFGRKLELK
jgi:hypothetical protein